MRNLFTGERLPRPVLTQLERSTGGDNERATSVEKVVKPLKNSKFMEPGSYKLPLVRDPVEYLGLPEDLDQEFERFEELLSFVSNNYELFAMWMHIRLQQRRRHSISISEMAASDAEIAYLDFLSDEKIDDKREYGRLKEWYQASETRTYNDFRKKTLRYYWYEFNDRANQTLQGDSSQGVTDSKQGDAQFRMFEKVCEAARAKLAAGGKLLPFEEEAIELIETGQDRKGRSVRAPATFIPLAKPTQSDGDDSQGYEVDYFETKQDRIYMQPAEEAEYSKLIRLATEFDRHSTWNIKMKMLSDSISKFERILEDDRKSGDAEKISNQEYQLNKYKAEWSYQTKHVLDSSVSRKDVAQEYFSQDEEVEKLASKMGDVWNQKNIDYRAWLSDDEVSKLSFEENLSKLGFSLERLLDEIPSDTYIKQRFLKTFRGNKK